MIRLPEYIDPHLIWIRNFPSDFLATEIQEFIDLCLMNTTATVVSITKNKSALVRFSTTVEPKHYIRELHQRVVKDRLLSVAYAKKLSPSDSIVVPSTSSSTTEIKQNFSEFFKKLHATDSLFEQPPPPHLRYVYPKANRDILDAITIALETTPKLYTQVLHLMNRMNLEPPFVVGAKNLVWPSSKTETCRHADLVFQDAFTQTDRLNDTLIASDESELESEKSDVEMQTIKRTGKRRTLEKVPNPKRIRSMLQSVQNGYTSKLNGHTVTQTTVIADAFEVSKSVIDRSIVINAPIELTPAETSADLIVGSINVIQTQPQMDSSNVVTDSLEKRLSVEQLNSHPLFQNYSPGEPSNKLYLKNLAKDVDEEDLKAIYSKFIRPGQSVDIRVMKTGRMKGQAFVCFNDPYMDDESGYSVVEKALRETNGLIVKDKVIVVMYGKK